MYTPINTQEEYNRLLGRRTKTTAQQAALMMAKVIHPEWVPKLLATPLTAEKIANKRILLTGKFDVRRLELKQLLLNMGASEVAHDDSRLNYHYIHIAFVGKRPGANKLSRIAAQNRRRRTGSPTIEIYNSEEVNNFLANNRMQ